MVRRIIQFGAGGHAKVVLEALLAAEPEALVTLLDDDPDAQARTLSGIGVSGGKEWLSGHWEDAPVVPAIGNNAARAKLAEWLLRQGRSLKTVIHPAAVVSPSVTLGPGSFMAAGAVINAESAIAEAVIINTGASVDHDCRIGASSHIAPGVRLCGGVAVGERTLVGTGSAVIPGIRIGSGAIIGAGSTVIADIPDGARVAGCPARPI